MRQKRQAERRNARAWSSDNSLLVIHLERGIGARAVGRLADMSRGPITNGHRLRSRIHLHRIHSLGSCRWLRSQYEKKIVTRRIRAEITIFLLATLPRRAASPSRSRLFCATTDTRRHYEIRFRCRNGCDETSSRSSAGWPARWRAHVFAGQ